MNGSPYYQVLVAPAGKEYLSETVAVVERPADLLRAIDILHLVAPKAHVVVFLHAGAEGDGGAVLRIDAGCWRVGEPELAIKWPEEIQRQREAARQEVA